MKKNEEADLCRKIAEPPANIYSHKGCAMRIYVENSRPVEACGLQIAGNPRHGILLLYFTSAFPVAYTLALLHAPS